LRRSGGARRLAVFEGRLAPNLALTHSLIPDYAWVGAQGGAGDVSLPSASPGPPGEQSKRTSLPMNDLTQPDRQSFLRLHGGGRQPAGRGGGGWQPPQPGDGAMAFCDSGIHVRGVTHRQTVRRPCCQDGLPGANYLKTNKQRMSENKWLRTRERPRRVAWEGMTAPGAKPESPLDSESVSSRLHDRLRIRIGV
jgi:hypothetical protein